MRADLDTRGSPRVLHLQFVASRRQTLTRTQYRLTKVRAKTHKLVHLLGQPRAEPQRAKNIRFMTGDDCRSAQAHPRAIYRWSATCPLR